MAGRCRARGAGRARDVAACVLLDGPRGIGKRTLALNLARALLCETPGPGGLACGTCASCRYVAAGQHPDLQLVEPFSIDDDGEVKVLDPIPVDRIRALIEWVQLTSHRGRAKVAVIVPAEAMNAAAANALLKTLEEPPPSTYLMLVAHQPGRVPADAAQSLPPHAGAAARDGRRGRMARAAAAWRRHCRCWRRPAARRWRRWRWPPPSGRPSARCGCRRWPSRRRCRRWRSPRASRRRPRISAANGWAWPSTGSLAWTADLGRVAAGGPPSRNIDFAAAFDRLASAVAPIPLFRYHRSLLRQRVLVAHPLQPRLVAEALLIGYRELFR